ncbi:MAG: hypothetical protein ACM3VZ_14580 [Acidobacteriota bacterium]
MRFLHRPLGSTVLSSLPGARRVAARWAASALALGGACAVYAAPTEGLPAKALQTPDYGQALYHFFQDDDFAALTSLQVAQQRRRIALQDDEVEALRSRMLLDYGMHREAGDVLARLAERGGTPEARDRAWFSLAQQRYQKGQFALAEEALARVQRPLPGALEQDRGLLQAQLLMSRSDYRGAVRVLKALLEQHPRARFVRYNLGVAQTKAGDTAEGTATLDALGSESADTDEERALRDRTNVALGFAALTAQQPAAARRYLERVPLQGPESNKALLGYGWAALDQQAPQAALVPWTALAKRDASDAAVLEAKVAVPYAYERLHANGKALQQYNEAIQSFERERQGLDAAIEFVRSGRLAEALLTGPARGDSGSGWRMDALPEVPHTHYLTALFAQNAFQQAYKSLRDLRQLQQRLQAGQDKLGSFKDELAARRQAQDQRSARANALASESSLSALRQRVDALEADIAQAQFRTDVSVFADERQREQLARIARVQAIVDKPGNAPEIVRARERLRLVSGLLNWQLAQEQAARLSTAQTALAAAKADLAQAQGRAAVITQTLRDEPQRLARWNDRVQTLATQFDVARPKVAALAVEQQNVLQEMALEELTRQKENLATYLVQARFAVAQLYDQAAASAKAQSGASRGTGNKEAADAPKP